MHEVELKLGKKVADLAVGIMDRLPKVAANNPEAFPEACWKSHEVIAEITHGMPEALSSAWKTLCIFDGFLLRWKSKGPTAEVLAEMQRHREAWIFNAAMLGSEE